MSEGMDEVGNMKRDDLLELVLAMMEYIDAIPKDAVLPAMPGFDRDWADDVIDRALLKERQLYSALTPCVPKPIQNNGNAAKP